MLIHEILEFSYKESFLKEIITSKVSQNKLLWVRFDEVTPKKLPLLERFQ